MAVREGLRGLKPKCFRNKYCDDTFKVHDNDGVLLHLFSPLYLRRYYEERQGLSEDEPNTVPE